MKNFTSDFLKNFVGVLLMESRGLIVGIWFCVVRAIGDIFRIILMKAQGKGMFERLGFELERQVCKPQVEL